MCAGGCRCSEWFLSLVFFVNHKGPIYRAQRAIARTGPAPTVRQQVFAATPKPLSKQLPARARLPPSREQAHALGVAQHGAVGAGAITKPRAMWSPVGDGSYVTEQLCPASDPTHGRAERTRERQRACVCDRRWPTACRHAASVLPTPCSAGTRCGRGRAAFRIGAPEVASFLCPVGQAAAPVLPAPSACRRRSTSTGLRAELRAKPLRNGCGCRAAFFVTRPRCWCARARNRPLNGSDACCWMAGDHASGGGPWLPPAFAPV